MRLSVEGSVLTDPRFDRLARELRIARPEALGRVLAVWNVGYERRCACMPIVDADLASGLDGFALALASADLARLDGDEVILRGVDDRIGFLLRHAEEQARKGRRSGEVRRDRAEQRRGSSDANQSGTDVQHAVDDAGAMSLAGAVLTASAAARDASGAPDAHAPAKRSKKPVARRAAASPMPAGWEPNARARELAAELGVDCDREAAHFRDYSAAQDKRWADWHAAFASWLRKAREFKRGGTVGARHVGRIEPKPASDYPDGDLPWEAP
jgi:hypothetical protein